MRYYLFLDECGDHGLAKPDPDFPVFLLCAVLIAENNYEVIRQKINILKETIWKDKKVIFHSRDIRRCENEFQMLFDPQLKELFYEGINEIVSQPDYSIVASAIRKNEFIEKFGRLQDDVYEIALSFVIEQAVLILRNIEQAELAIVIERRGAKEDKRLNDRFQRLCARGTAKLTSEDFDRAFLSFIFRNKKENINGLQLADLVAYPIARHVIEPDKANPSFDVLAPKIYKTSEGLEGLKIYP